MLKKIPNILTIGRIIIVPFFVLAKTKNGTIIILPIVRIFGIFFNIVIRERSYISFLLLFLQHLQQILFHLN